MLRFFVFTFVCALVLLALVGPVRALIKVEFTVEKLYKDSKAAVVVGKVTEVVPEKRLINVALTQTLKGKSPGAAIRVVLVAPPEMAKEITVGEPLMFFLTDEKGSSGAVIHLHDTWLLANLPDGAPNLLGWQVKTTYDTLKPSFPGRTSALVTMATEVAAGTTTFLNEFKRKPFEGGMKKRVKLPVQKAAWILAEDFNGDKKPDLLIGTAAGTQLFLAAGDGYEDATEAWGLKGASGKFHAAGDVNGDGKIDLLLDGTVWINQGTKFVASKAALEIPKGTPLATALIDANGDQKPDAIFLTAEGEVRVFENSGSPDKPWTARPAKTLWTGGDAPIFATLGDFGDTAKPHAFVLTKNGATRYALDADGGPAANLTRLTGLDPKKLEKYQGGFKNATAVTLSINGESRPDVLIYSDAGSLLFVNRGLGTFFVDETASTNLAAGGALPLTPSPATVWTHADLHGKGVDDVLLLGEDGTLYELSNSK